MRPQPSRRAKAPQLTSLRSCLITDEESEPLLRSYNGSRPQAYTNVVLSPTFPSSGRRRAPEPVQKSSALSAFFHIVCVMAGTGILQLPYALKSGGWVSLFWIFLSGPLVAYSGRFTMACLYHDGLNRLNGYIDIGGAAFGKTGRRLVEASIASLIIGASGLYLILAAENLVQLDSWTGWTRRECFGGNVVFPHVESTMRNPKAFNAVLTFSLGFVTALYAAVAAVGYLAYGDKTESPIFDNLPPSPILTIAIVMLILHLLFTIPINLASFALDVEHSLGFNSGQLSLSQQSLYRVSFRVFVSLITLALAIAVPYFDHVMALLGALSNGLLILPPILFVKLHGWRAASTTDKLASIVMGTTGLFILVVGSSQALQALYRDVYPTPI
ncbi:hypothetical protein L0F63_000108 [Massospora cicadina]|nr:hypothetical protein L0F63_000108 [Massospora cicadina]